MKIEKVDKLATNLHDKTEYVYSHKKFKAPIKSRISLEKCSCLAKFIH